MKSTDKAHCVSVWACTSILMLICASIHAIPALSQAQDSITVDPKDGYVKSMDDYLGLKFSLNNDFESFALESPGYNIELYPNFETVARLGFNYRFLSFSISYSPEFLPGNDDDELRGKTKSLSIDGSILTDHWFHFGEAGYVKGYYLQNSEDFIPNFSEGDAFIQFPDLLYYGIQGVTGYSFNPRFSFRAISTQTERQLKSVGSFMPQTRYRLYRFTDETELTPGRSRQSSWNLEWVIGPSYYYNFVLKERFYLAIGSTVAGGFIRTWLSTEFYGEEPYKSGASHFMLRWDLKTGFGYNGEHLFAGFNFDLYGAEYQQGRDIPVYNHELRAVIEVFVGWRFTAPGKLSRGVDEVERLKKRAIGH